MKHFLLFCYWYLFHLHAFFFTFCSMFFYLVSTLRNSHLYNAVYISRWHSRLFLGVLMCLCQVIKSQSITVSLPTVLWVTCPVWQRNRRKPLHMQKHLYSRFQLADNQMWVLEQNYLWDIYIRFMLHDSMFIAC